MSLRLIVIPLALLTALALALIALQITHAPAPVAEGPVAPPPPLMVSVLVAAHPMSAGTLVRDEDFAVKMFAPSELKGGSFRDSPDMRAELRGALVRKFIELNEQVQRADLLRARDRGFLAAVLEPGTRAVSIAVDAVTGVAGLIWPGDRVDVILTQELDATSTPLSHRIFGETVMSDVRVIAVDQQISEGGVSNGGAEGVGKLAHTVTLQVATDQAERVTVANRLGHLALAVRAIDSGALRDSGTVFSSDVSPELSASARRNGSHMQVIQGDKREDVTFQ